MEEFQPETPGAARTVQDSNLVELGGQSQEAFFVARRPTLPWDILLIIMRFVASKRVISRLMRTCHTLYTHGLPLVAEACMLLPHQNMSSVILFCKFMLRPPAPGHYPRLVTCPLGLHKPVIIPGPFQLPRPLLLRELILPGSGLENLRQTCRGVKEDLDVLAYVLSQAQNLETLGLGCMEDLLTKNTRFCTVIMMMKKLDMVLFREVKRMAMAVLNSIQSPVTKAIIAFPKIRPRVAFNPALERAYPAMTAFRDTLERLQLLELPIRYTMPDKPFLRVHSLTLRMHSAANIGLHNIALAFPHLRNLSWSYASEMIDWEELEERRELSLARTYQGWPSLKKLRCNDSVAYALAFRCPVQYWVGRYLDHPVQLPVFHCALRDLRPKHLYFSLHIPAFISDLKWVFPESENRITHLNLDWCTQEDEGLNWLQDCEDPATLLADMFDQLVLAAGALRSLSFLVLRFQYNEHPFDVIPDRSYSQRIVDRYLKGMNTLSLAKRLSGRLPELKQLLILFKHEHQPDGQWLVSRGRGNIILLTELSNEQRQATLDRCPFAEEYRDPFGLRDPNWKLRSYDGSANIMMV